MSISFKLRVAMSTLALAGATAVQAGSVDVFVGYADNLRPSGFFPTVWLGDPNVFSETPLAQSFDAGAIRIDNHTGAPVTISNFQVTFPNIGGTFALWSSLVLPDGSTGIFTQTGSYNFDTSDFGIFGGLPPNALAPNNYLGNGNTNLIGGCSSSAALIAGAGETAACNASAPVISFLANGNPFSFTDTGQILNTGVGISSTTPPSGKTATSRSTGTSSVLAPIGAAHRRSPSLRPSRCSDSAWLQWLLPVAVGLTRT